MARGKRGGGGGRVGGGKGSQMRPENFEDEVDVFHKQRDTLALNMDDDDEGSDDDLEQDEEVFGVQGADEDSSDEDEDDDELDEEHLTGLAAKMAKQAKIMRQKAGGAREEDEEEEDEEEGEDGKGPGWGKKKKAYYSADNLDYELQSDDEDAPLEEEKEALRLQRSMAAALRPEDYEQDEDVDEDEDEEEEDDEEEEEETMQVKGGEYVTAEGLSYLEAKHLLLLTYCSSIVFYLLLRAEGRSVRDHPVITRLVELRLLLEKIRPIDKKLQYQIEKLLKAAQSQPGSAAAAAANGGAPGGAAGQKDDALKYRPNPDMLVSKVNTADAQEEGGGVYRPPKLVPTAMDTEEDGRARKGEGRVSKDARNRAARSAFVRQLADELEGRPEEVREVVGVESADMERERQRLQARAQAEENLFARVPLSRPERVRLRALQRNRNSLAGMLDDFDDDVADFVDEEDGDAADGGPPAGLLKRRKMSQAIAEAGRPAKKQTLMSGDADVPSKAGLGERRRAHENKLLQRGNQDVAFDDDDDDDAGGDDVGPTAEPEEDEFYKEAKERRSAKLAAKSAKYSRESAVPQDEEAADGKRSITYQMEKNKGLTPHRKKLTKNPRKKYKLAHAKAVVRRKGQVRDVKVPTASYGGEATGIKSSISRSVRMAG
eukprot:jgi/Mesen1/5016/ME000025S04418